MGASNSEVQEAAGIANAREFIENNLQNTFEDSSDTLVKEMKKNSEGLIQRYGEKKYNEMLEQMEKIKKEEEKKGKFLAVKGEID